MDYKAAARRFARRYGLDPNVFVRQINAESGFNPRAVSPAGARGIAQFMPGTAAGLHINPDNPVQALEGAAKLMASYVRKYGSYRDALVAYNAGPGRVGRPLPSETQRYVQNILGGSNPSPKGAGSTTRTVTTTTPGVDNSGTRAQLLSQYLASPAQRHDPTALISLFGQLRQAGDVAPTSSSVTTSSGGSSVPRASGTAKFDGKPVAGWIAPILQFARQHGWTGTVNSGVRSYADQQRIYNSGVRPAARPGTSNHEGTQFPRGAVDVTNAAQLAAILRRSRYAGALQWAGPKDPVHFSHPHGGSY